VSFEHDDMIDLSGARDVRLGGRDWKVAPLSLRQVLAIADYVPKLSSIGVDTLSGERLAPLAEVLWHGLRRAYPKLTRDEFYDLPITIGELVAALPVVIEQAGGRRVDSGESAAAADGAAAAGEIPAASASIASTGARSSPTS
jgi:hypothetical protein